MSELSRIAVLGPPAAGKSSVIDLLLCELGSEVRYFDLDEDVLEICEQRELSGPLTDCIVDEAVFHCISRSEQALRAVIELAHHDYVQLLGEGLAGLNNFDAAVVITAPLAVLLERNSQRQFVVPDSYIARCFGATAALSESLKNLDYPWLLLDAGFMTPPEMASLVLHFLRAQTSDCVQEISIVPCPEFAYLGGSYHSAVEWSAVLAERIVSKYEIESVLDVGCGSGLALDQFAALGIDAWGLEGNPTVLNGPCQSKHRLLISDFCKQWVKLPCKFDLVWCVEVLEHVNCACEENVLRTIASNAGRIVFISAAAPGQTGYNHVNCKPKSYWIEKFEQMDFRLLKGSQQLLGALEETSGLFERNFIAENGFFLEAL